MIDFKRMYLESSCLLAFICMALSCNSPMSASGSKGLVDKQEALDIRMNELDKKQAQAQIQTQTQAQDQNTQLSNPQFQSFEDPNPDQNQVQDPSVYQNQLSSDNQVQTLEDGKEGGLKDNLIPSGKVTRRNKTKNVDCDFSYNSDFSPIYMDDQKVAVMNLKAICKQDLTTGETKNYIYYTLMGIPCTGEAGNMKIFGGYYAPKMITYSLDTSCKMSNVNRELVEQRLRRITEVQDESIGFVLASYTPMDIRYWRIEGWKDSGVGSTVSFRSLKIKTELWPSMRDRSSSVGVELYGRENSWSESSMVGVKIAMKNLGDSRFSIQIDKAWFLDSTEQKNVQQECLENHKNKSDCLDI